MSRLPVNYIKSVPDTLLQASNNIGIITPLVTNLDESRYTNIVQNLVNTPSSFTGTTSRASATTITPLTTSIVTVKSNARIYISMLVSLETHWDNVFYVTSSINGGPQSELITKGLSARSFGFTSAPYDNNNDSTMGQISFKWVHETTSNAGDTITYSLRFYSGAVLSLWLNQTQNATNSASYERGSSIVILEEINY
jgi:hypothetical protein